MSYLGRGAEILVGLAFAWAGVVKLMDPSAFLAAILTYEVFGHAFAVVASLLVPYLEVCVGAGLVFGTLKQGSRLIAIALLIAFVVLLVQAAIRGLDADCGCFGGSEMASESGYAWPIARDVLMLAGLAIGIVVERVSRDKSVR